MTVLIFLQLLISAVIWFSELLHKVFRSGRKWRHKFIFAPLIMCLYPSQQSTILLLHRKDMIKNYDFWLSQLFRSLNTFTKLLNCSRCYVRHVLYYLST